MAMSEHLKADVSTVHLGGLRVMEHQGRRCADITVLKN